VHELVIKSNYNQYIYQYFQPQPTPTLRAYFLLGN